MLRPQGCIGSNPAISVLGESPNGMAHDSKSCGRNAVSVRPTFPPPRKVRLMASHRFAKPASEMA